MPGVALLIGNSQYRFLAGLRTPSTDVHILGDALHDLGFETYVTADSDAANMRQHIAEFRAKVDRLDDDGSVFFYFAGHGAQWNGEDYLLPTDQLAPTDGRWSLQGVPLSRVLSEICWRSAAKLIALDVCRTVPAGSSSSSVRIGFSEREPHSYAEVRETMILHAATPGHPAYDGAMEGSSPFCRAMVDVLKRPDRPLHALAGEVARNVVKYTRGQQRVWEGGNLAEKAEVPFWPIERDGEVQSGYTPMPAPVPTAATAPSPEPLPPLSRAVDAEIAKRGHLVHKLKAKDTTGNWAYYFIFIEPEREPAFLRAVEGSGTVDIASFGNVIASCYGQEPTPEVRTYLKAKYNFDV